MVQLSLALACLLAGADAFGVTPPEVTKPTDGPPAFIVHEGVGWCQSKLDFEMWYVGEEGSFADGVDKTADKCWTDCQAEYPVVGRSHEFKNDGKETWCYCQSGCECMNDVGDDNTLAPPDWKAPSACLPPVPPPECECQDMWIDEDCSGTTQKGCPITNCEGDTRSWCYLKATPCTVGPDFSTYDYDYDGDGDPTTGAPMPNWMYCTPEVPSASPSPPPSAPVVIVPKFSEYNDKCAPSENDFVVEGMGTAKDCWETCQLLGEQNTGDNPNPVPSHQFLDWTKSGEGTECYCKTSCDCFVAEEDPCNTPRNGITNNAQNGECACELQGFNEGECNAIGCCQFNGGSCSSAVGPGPCYSRRRLQEEPAAHTTLALPDWEGCTAPVVKTVSSTITCSKGLYPDEIGWSLSCDDGTTLSGLGEAWGGLTLGSVEEGKALAVALGAACTLEMTGTLEDSWESAVWSGFGQSFSAETGDESYTVRAFPLGDLDTTYIKTIDFVVQAPEDLS